MLKYAIYLQVATFDESDQDYLMPVETQSARITDKLTLRQLFDALDLIYETGVPLDNDNIWNNIVKPVLEAERTAVKEEAQAA